MSHYRHEPRDEDRYVRQGFRNPLDDLDPEEDSARELWEVQWHGVYQPVWLGLSVKKA